MTKYGQLLGGVSAAALAATALATFGAPTSAQAAGFEIREQSAVAQGTSIAGATASAEDISLMYFNPAAIAFHNSFGTSINSAVILPTAKVSNAEASAATGAPISGSADTTDEIGLLASTYVSAPLTDELYAGLAITAPFGLVTDYDRDWVGRYHGVTSDLKTINVSPTIAFRPVPQLAIAAGAQIQYVYANLTNAVDFGLIGASLPGGDITDAGGGADGFADLEGDDIALGFTAGLIYEPLAGTRLGVAYKSEIDHRLEGDVTFTGDSEGNFATITAFSNTFTSGQSATADYRQPAKVNLGFYQELNDQVAIMGDAQWTQWSSFEELRVDFSDDTPDNVTEQDWDDQWFLSLGVRYRPTDELTLRTGFAYDQAAAPDDRRTPRIPDTDRYWLSFGASYDWSDAISLNAGYTYLIAEDAEINLTADGDNATRGSLSADVEADVHILAVGGSIKF